MANHVLVGGACIHTPYALGINGSGATTQAQSIRVEVESTQAPGAGLRGRTILTRVLTLPTLTHHPIHIGLRGTLGDAAKLIQ